MQTARGGSAARDAAFSWPVDGPITSGFGRRHLLGWHRGVDIQAPARTPIRAAASGTVLYSGWQSSYGRVIRIAHPSGFTTLYAHNSKNVVTAGDRVRAGAVIGAVGRSGLATGNHLHFEIQRDGKAQDPLPMMAHRGTSLAALAPRAHSN